MKHNLKITLVILITFLLAQFLGIGVLYKYIDTDKSLKEGKTTFKELPIGERPPVEEQTSFLPIILVIIIGTGILLLLIKYNLQWVWKAWFLIAVVISLGVAWSAFVWRWLALLLAFALGAWKVYRPNFWIHNLTELFIYGGLAAIFVPLFNLWSVSILMVLIAIYDAYAVWKSKHMITLAKSQTKAKVFAGLMIPYQAASGKIIKRRGEVKKAAQLKRAVKAKGVPIKVRTAILGGGDIGFPLIFAGVVLKEIGLWQSLIIPFFAGLGLGYLMYYGDKRKFYPAMPFIGAGCFLGLLLVWLIGLV